MHFALYRNFAFFSISFDQCCIYFEKKILSEKIISEKNWSILHKSAHQFINYHLLGYLKSDDETKVNWKFGKNYRKNA
jgi:hypothetical protein